MYAKRRIFVCQVATSGANFREGQHGEVSRILYFHGLR